MIMYVRLDVGDVIDVVISSRVPSVCIVHESSVGSGYLDRSDAVYVPDELTIEEMTPTFLVPV